jgi:hypothetical protein
VVTTTVIGWEIFKNQTVDRSSSDYLGLDCPNCCDFQ